MKIILVIILGVAIFAVLSSLIIDSCGFKAPIPKIHLSGNFSHRSTETISDHETIDLYYDSLNENTCYLYKDSEGRPPQLSCVPRVKYLQQ